MRGKARGNCAHSPLRDAPLALEFLRPVDVARLVCAEKRATADAADALWFWLVARARRLLPHLQLPLEPPARAFARPAALLVLLRRLHAVSTYAFNVRFDTKRHGGDVYLPKEGGGYVSHWGAVGGSMLGDSACPRNAVSYWECEGLSEGSYVGVAEIASDGQPGFRYYGLDAQHLKRTLSLPSPACDHMPAVMYCESGFITNGSFRGPKPQLPSRVGILHATPFLETDRVGVFVDRIEGFVVFTRNGQVEGMAISLSRDSDKFVQAERAYIPVFTASSCYDLRLLPNASPPWHSIYHFREMLELLNASTHEDNQVTHERDVTMWTARGA